MVIAAVTTMIIIVTFRIPYGAVGVNCAFILSRENLLSTAKSGFYFTLAFAAWVVFMPVGARMFASVPLTHFLWEAVTVFLCFFLLKTLTYFPLATGVVVVATSTMVIWFLPGPAELNDELTLWQILATAVGALITFLVEVVFRFFVPGSPLTNGITDRLRSIEVMLNSDEASIETASRAIIQYAITGTSILRQQVARSHLGTLERSKMNVLIALVGRGIDLAAAISAGHKPTVSFSVQRTDALAIRISRLREKIHTGSSYDEPQKPLPESGNRDLLSELSLTIQLMESVLATQASIELDAVSIEESGARNALFVKDAFSNPEYLRFALAGTAASMLCYIIYVGLNWPGISTAVTTCALTALSDIGSSRQKQLLRIGGAAIGGFVFGLGSQIFILPYIDSIVGLTILFACVTGISAYVATSSPRLSYAGLQMAFAFYLINVTDFTVSLDLTIGRDRAIGVLLGIASMWLVFERLFPRPAAFQMVRMFARSARLVANMITASATNTQNAGLISLRDEIAGTFASVNAEADAVIFESGDSRPAYLAARDRIRRWLPTLRTVYLLALPLLPFGRVNKGSGSEAEWLTSEMAAPLICIAEIAEQQLGEASRAQRDLTEAKVPCTLRQWKEISQNMPSDKHDIRTSAQFFDLVHELERDVLREPIFDDRYTASREARITAS
jgi:multidrug resistance protein MdtO